MLIVYGQKATVVCAFFPEVLLHNKTEFIPVWTTNRNYDAKNEIIEFL